MNDRLSEIEARLDAATAGEWFWNSYSAIQAGDLISGWDERAEWYPEDERPYITYQKTGGAEGCPAFAPADQEWCERQAAAYEADPTVAWVPSLSGDTSTGRHEADADLIAHAPDDLRWLLGRVRELEDQIES